MTDGTRQLLALSCMVAGLGWWLGVEVWRGRSQDHAARVFWLHLTAPLAAIALMLVAFWLLFTTKQFSWR